MPGRIGAAWDALTIDEEAFEKERDRLVRGVLGAGMGAIQFATKKLERDLEEATRIAVKGRAWRAWKSTTYPKGGIARAPVGEVFLNGRDRTYGMIDFFTKSGRIKGKRDQWLAIPTEAAGSRGRMRNLTPGEWERRNGARLRFVYRGNKPSMLVLDEGVLSGKKQVARLNTARRRASGRGNATIVIFFLVPMVPFANRFAIEPRIEASEGALMKEFVERVRALP